ncbi:MAG TPA: thiopeptide-type bacteriocin biosynthesis protein [Thermoanaerobaculia bacterium]|nr:thiopeptide-type bacteriocin biosynthesis protein [Thermoanaerobaculia bacterium]
MLTGPATLPSAVKLGASCWISYNLYTSSGDEALRGVIAPAVADLLRRRSIRGFFFVRYFDERGPHLRVRLDVAESRLEEADAAFVAGVLSRLDAPTPGDRLLPSEIELEVERYGGPAAHLAALDFFCLSSLHALEHVRRHHAARPVQRLKLATSLLLWQALGFARTVEELRALLDYFSGWRPALAAVVAKADEAFDRHPEGWCELLHRAIRIADEAAESAAGDLGSAGAIFTASRGLSRQTEEVPSAARAELARSQMHMTANRIGLSNAWEIYLSQILCRSAAAAEAADPAFLPGLERRLSHWRSQAHPAGAVALAELVADGLARFAAGWPSR